MNKRTSQTRSTLFTCGALLLIGAVIIPSFLEAASLPIRIGNMVITKEVQSIQDLKFDKVIRQSTDYSCGAASLATLLSYYFGRETTEQEILNTVMNGPEDAVQRIKENGISLLDLKNYGESVGFVGKGFKLKVDQLQDLDRPAIVLINADGYNHFVVIKEIVGDKVHVADPVKGNIIFRLDEFDEIWNGILLAFRKSEGEKVKSHALYAKQVLPDEKFRLVPRLNDIGTVISAPADF